jgi:hypothetical protein
VRQTGAQQVGEFSSVELIAFALGLWQSRRVNAGAKQRHA